MNWIIQLAVTQIVKWAAGLTKEDWLQIANFVRNAEHRFIESAQKKAEVVKMVKEAWPKLADWTTNLLIELAVAKVRKGAA